MAIATFRFHGEVEEFLAREHRGTAFDCACARAATLKHAIEALGVPHTEVGHLMVNGNPATQSRIVRDGDVVQVFPQDIVAADMLTAPCFVADAHLGGLARMLRMLGFDTVYNNTIQDREIIDLAAREHRIVLTRDRELLKCREIMRGRFVHAIKPEAQLREVAARYGLEHHMQPFTLCLHCNLPLAMIEKNAVRGHVPDRIADRYAEFARCPGCQRIYWQGSHWERMRQMLSAALYDGNPLSDRGLALDAGS
jgi:uncharacterized protein with PIN domain